MRRVPARAFRRRASIAPLTAILLVIVLGMLAFSIDMGYIVLARAELQNAADAAALAGVEQLENYYVQYYTPGTDQSSILASAKSQATLVARTYTGFHQAGGTSSLALDTTNDLQLGYQDSTTPFQSPPPNGYFPNTVQVTLRLDGGATTNPALNLFFAPVLGMRQTTVTVTARATIYNGTPTTFSGPDGNLLPATLDRDIWNSFVATGKGSLPDFNYTAPTSNAPSNLSSPAVAGAPQIQVVPDPNGRPGGWNYLSLDSSSNSNKDLKGWFSSGLGQSDLNALTSGGQLPLPAQPSDPTQATYYWKGIPGNRGGSEPFPPPGSVRLLPLYIHVPVSQSGAGNYIASNKGDGQFSSGGVGQNTWFNIVQFVGVVVTDNSNGGLSVQPAAVSDPNMTLTNIQTAGPPPSGQLNTFFAAPKLTY